MMKTAMILVLIACMMTTYTINNKKIQKTNLSKSQIMEVKKELLNKSMLNCGKISQ